MCKLSIIIPAYITHDNTMLGQTVTLLSDLFFKTRGIEEHEVILVDDGSDNRSICVIEKRFPKLKIISNIKNIGFAKSINNGISNCIGKRILLLNNDIKILERGWLVNLINGMEHFDADIVSPKQSMLDKQYEYIPDANKSYYKENKCFCYPVGWCLLVNRSVFDRAGLLPVDFGIGFWEDTAWAFNIINNHPEFKIKIIEGIDKVQISHMEHQTFRSSNIDIKSLYERNRRIFLEYVRGERKLELPQLK